MLNIKKHCNVGKTINHPIFDGLYHPFIVIWGMVYYCFNHCNSYHMSETRVAEIQKMIPIMYEHAIFRNSCMRQLIDEISARIAGWMQKS